MFSIKNNYIINKDEVRETAYLTFTYTEETAGVSRSLENRMPTYEYLFTIFAVVILI